MKTRRNIDVVVAGLTCCDLTPSFGKSAPSSIEEIFAPGKLVNVGMGTVAPGGAVPNTGLALLRVGIKTELMGKVGDDFFGRATVASLKKLGAEKGIVVAKGEDSPYTIVIAPPGIDRMFLHHPGVNDTFGFKDVNFDRIKQARLFHLGYPPLMKKLYANGGKDLVRIYRKARALGTTTSLDMALADPASPAGKVNWNSILKATLPYVDIFLPSAEEAMFILDKKEFLDRRKRAKGKDLLNYFEAGDLSRMAGKLLGYGVKIAGIKCGHRGFYMRTGSKDRLAHIGFARPADLNNWSNRELWKPSFRVKRFASAAGAGDCSIAGFLAGYLKGESIESTLEYANALGAQNVQMLDTTSGVKTWKETTRQIKAGWAKSKLTIKTPGWEFDPALKLWRGPADRPHFL